MWSGSLSLPITLCPTEPLGIVRQDAEVGASLDIHGTPRVYFNDKLYRSGTSAEVMARAIELALGSTAADAAKAAASLREKADNRGAIPADVPAQREVALGALKFKIDTFEAGITDGAATVGKHQVPAFFVSWFDAKSACEKAGKRLCTEAEWVSTCQNAVAVDDNNNGELADDMIKGTAYPYGDYHEDRRCWDDQDDDKHRPVYTGELPGCVTPSRSGSETHPRPPCCWAAPGTRPTITRGVIVETTPSARAMPALAPASAAVATEIPNFKSG